ncbi:F0F1 ATP synthase subunit delta [Pseudoclavibacter soli]|uniref:F0F1 ATP synthase subunit delta n=1 Tax=Pseudoclavibacter soli TaxID=452623 RepID=UPI0004226EC1|nr:F0F1 ATP synthase subunit delta [Pseudoclavibacter soli]
MGNATTQSFKEARATLTRSTVSGTLDYASALFTVADTLGESAQLRGVVADPSTEPAERSAVITKIFSGHVPAAVLTFVEKIAALRWSTPDELVSSVDTLGVLSVAKTASKNNTIEQLERELFEIAQVFSGSRELQLTLTNPGEHREAESALIQRLFGTQVSPEAIALTERAVAQVRGSKVSRRLDEIAAVVSGFVGRKVAQVRSATALTDQQRSALAKALTTEAGGPVHVNVAVDPTLIGGVVVRLGDTLIDSSAKTKLEQLRQAIA